MLNENIKTIRKNKGFTQAELAIRLHVTRQTVSKWEKGTSVPDAALLLDMAEILDVSVSELLGEKAVEKQDQDAIIEQLSRINEQMAVRNNRSANIIKTLTMIFVIILIIALTIIVINVKNDKARHKMSDHIGKLAYDLPDSNFVHDENDVGVSIEEGRKERISAKSYKCYDDMTEITIWEYDYPGDIEILDEFKTGHKDDMVTFSDEHGSLPTVVDEIFAATDVTEGYVGRYYVAYVVIQDKMYCVEVQNGDGPKACGELLIASMNIDESLKDEYRN